MFERPAIVCVMKDGRVIRRVPVVIKRKRGHRLSWAPVPRLETLMRRYGGDAAVVEDA